MMQFLIDNVSAFEKFDVVIPKGERNALLRYPTREAVRYTNFAEVDGIHADLRKAKFQRRRVNLKVFMLARGATEFHAKRKAFLDAISRKVGQWVTLDFGLGYSSQWQLISHTNTEAYRVLSGGTQGFFMTVNIEEYNFPRFLGSILGGTDPIAPIPVAWVPRGEMSINGRDIADFGAAMDYAYSGSTVITAESKEAFDDGLIITYNQKKKSLDLSLNLWLVSDSFDTLITNWKALYMALTGSGLQTITIRERGLTSKVFYRDCTAAEGYFSGRTKGIRLQLKVTAPEGI